MNNIESTLRRRAARFGIRIGFSKHYSTDEIKRIEARVDSTEERLAGYRSRQSPIQHTETRQQVRAQVKPWKGFRRDRRFEPNNAPSTLAQWRAIARPALSSAFRAVGRLKRKNFA